MFGGIRCLFEGTQFMFGGTRCVCLEGQHTECLVGHIVFRTGHTV